MTEKFHYSNIKDNQRYKPQQIEIHKDFLLVVTVCGGCCRHVMPWDFKCLTCAGQFCTKKNWPHIWTKKKKVAYFWRCIYFVFNIKWEASLKFVYCVRIMYLYTHFKLWRMQSTSSLCSSIVVFVCVYYCMWIRAWTLDHNPLCLKIHTLSFKNQITFIII